MQNASPPVNRDVDESAVVRWVILCEQHQENNPECLTPCSEGIWWLCYAVGGPFCWHSLSPLVPLKGRVTANQNKIVLSDHLWWNISILMGVVSSKMTVPNPRGMRGHWMSFVICYGLCSRHISTQFEHLSILGRPVKRSSPPSLKPQTRGIFLVFICEGGWRPNTLTKTLMSQK